MCCQATAAWREKEYGGGGAILPPAADTGYSYNADSYDSQMKRLEERKRQAQVDMDMDGVLVSDRTNQHIWLPLM